MSVTDDMERWMKFIPDRYSVTQLTLPGTHDSYASKTILGDAKIVEQINAIAGVISGYTFTQYSEIKTQLTEGVRYLDLRVGSPNFGMRHGSIPLGSRLEYELKTIKEWLDSHQSEAVLISVKWDHDGVAEPDDMAKEVKKMWDAYGWYYDNEWPKIGQVRGKAVLLRRFSIDTKVYPVLGVDFGGIYGLSYKAGPGAFDQQNKGNQDDFSHSQYWSICEAQIERAYRADFDDNCQYFTIMSMTGRLTEDWPGLDYPEKYAKDLNPHMMSLLNNDEHRMREPSKHRYGCIVMDFYRRPYGLELVSKNFEAIGYSPDRNKEIAMSSDKTAFLGLRAPNGDRVDFWFTENAVLRVTVNGNERWKAQVSDPGASSSEHALFFQEDGNLVAWAKDDARGVPERGGRRDCWETGTRYGNQSRIRFMAGPPYIIVDYLVGKEADSGSVLWSTTRWD